MTVEIISKEDWRETNPCANPNTANNGGGYSQPQIEMDLRINGIPVHLMYRDSSCGDFGSRERIEITNATGKHWKFTYGTMDDFHNEVSYIDQYDDLPYNGYYEDTYARYVCEDFIKTFDMSIAELYHAIF